MTTMTVTAIKKLRISSASKIGPVLCRTPFPDMAILQKSMISNTTMSIAYSELNKENFIVLWSLISQHHMQL